jgi:hypothetical protein
MTTMPSRHGLILSYFSPTHLVTLDMHIGSLTKRHFSHIFRRIWKPPKIDRSEAAFLSQEFMAGKRRSTQGRVARWFIFKPKIQIWVNFKRP